MVLIFRTCRVDKRLQEIYRFKVSTDVGEELKMHFGELEMRFMPTVPIHIV
jgi:hypothetical protein